MGIVRRSTKCRLLFDYSYCWFNRKLRFIPPPCIYCKMKQGNKRSNNLIISFPPFFVFVLSSYYYCFNYQLSRNLHQSPIRYFHAVQFFNYFSNQTISTVAFQGINLGMWHRLRRLHAPLPNPNHLYPG